MHGVLRTLGYVSIVLALACPIKALADDRKLADSETLEGTWRADVADSQSIVLSIKGSAIEMSAVTGEKRRKDDLERISLTVLREDIPHTRVLAGVASGRLEDPFDGYRHQFYPKRNGQLLCERPRCTGGMPFR